MNVYRPSPLYQKRAEILKRGRNYKHGQKRRFPCLGGNGTDWRINTLKKVSSLLTGDRKDRLKDEIFGHASAWLGMGDRQLETVG